MNTRILLIAPLTALLLGVGGASLAVTPAGDNATAMPSEPGTMKAETPDGMDARMSHMRRGGMSQGGMMNGGMMAMMGSCPMMGAGNGANEKVMMQMHGEMMRAMGDIMMKYADKLKTPAPAK